MLAIVGVAGDARAKTQLHDDGLKIALACLLRVSLSCGDFETKFSLGVRSTRSCQLFRPSSCALDIYCSSTLFRVRMFADESRLGGVYVCKMAAHL